MLLRAVLGAVTGAVAGFGFLSTMTLMIRYCDGGPSRTGCREVLLLIPLQFLFWVAVAGMLVVAGFRFLRQRHGGWVVGIAPVLWVVLVFAASYAMHEYLDLYQAERGPFLMVALVITACVAYAIAALGAGRAGRC
jgi:peptidoglycan/LPS O-acetylase OafA/YrhL